MLTLYVLCQSAWLSRPPSLYRDRSRSERGQATAEYALVLLGAAAVALLVVAWATHTNKVGKLLDVVLDKLLGRAR
jgi:hypothetical protein